MRNVYMGMILETIFKCFYKLSLYIYGRVYVIKFLIKEIYYFTVRQLHT